MDDARTNRLTLILSKPNVSPGMMAADIPPNAVSMEYSSRSKMAKRKMMLFPQTFHWNRLLGVPASLGESARWTSDYELLHCLSLTSILGLYVARRAESTIRDGTS